MKKAFSKGTLILTKMKGDYLPKPVNSDIVKKYYAWCTLPIKLKFVHEFFNVFSFSPKKQNFAWSHKLKRPCFFFHRGLSEIKVYYNADVKLVFVFNKQVLRIQVIS